MWKASSFTATDYAALGMVDLLAHGLRPMGSTVTCAVLCSIGGVHIPYSSVQAGLHLTQTCCLSLWRIHSMYSLKLGQCPLFRASACCCVDLWGFLSPAVFSFSRLSCKKTPPGNVPMKAQQRHGLKWVITSEDYIYISGLVWMHLK